MHAKSLHSCPILCDPMDYRLFYPWDSPGKNNWSGLPCPPLRDLPDPGIEPMSLTPPALEGKCFSRCFQILPSL